MSTKGSGPRHLARRYAVVVERGERSWGAYVPDLPGCVAVADSREAVERLIREAVAFHLEGLLKDGVPIPEPTSSVMAVEVAV